MEPISSQLHSILYYSDPSNYLSKLLNEFVHYTEEQAKEVIQFLKATIKSKKNPPTVKLQALKVIQCSMASKNPCIIRASAKKLYNRFRIFAEYKKENPNENRGTLLFNAESKVQQQASEDFLVLLLKCIKFWNDSYGIDSKGRQTQFFKLFSYLKSKNVSFPSEKKPENDVAKVRKNLVKIKKRVKNIIELISQDTDPKEIKKIAKFLKKSFKVIQDQIEKYMEMEDHELIKDLNNVLDLLSNAVSSYESWKTRFIRASTTQTSLFVLPPTCMFISDFEPKSLPVEDDLSQSFKEMNEYEQSSPVSILTDRDTENEKENTLNSEWTGLGADYCRLKDKFEQSELNVISFKRELECLHAKYLEELEEKEHIKVSLETVLNSEKSLKKEISDNFLKFSQETQKIQEENKLLNEKIKELESKLNDSLKDSIQKQEKIENLEGLNNSLTSTCKTLSQDVEKYLESEKFLKKEIKELFRKIEKKKPDKDSSSISSNSEIITHNDDSPSKEFKVALVTTIEEDKANLNVTIYEDSLETENNYHISVKETNSLDCYYHSRMPSDEFNKIDNVSYFTECMKRNHGLLFENGNIKVSFSVEVTGCSGKADVLIENKSGFDFYLLKTKIYGSPLDGLSISINEELCEKLENNSTIQRILVFNCSNLYENLPYLVVNYKIEEEIFQSVLLLPVAYTLFFKKPSIDFVKEWDSIEKYRETVSKTHFDSVKKLARSIIFNKNFDCSYIEGNGVIIATESPIGLVLAVVVLKEFQVSIQVKSYDDKLRDLISSLIVTQVLSDR